MSIYQFYYILLLQLQSVKFINMQKKQQVTTEQAKQWIRQHENDIRPYEWVRSKYYDKLGITPLKNTLQKEVQYQNDSYLMNFYSALSKDKIRQRYFNKLYMNGMMKQIPSKKHQNVFIFDWDDTILCTSYLSAFQFLDIGAQAKQMVKKLDQSAVKMLKKCTQKGDVYIITNAARGWVEHSSKIYLPQVFQHTNSSKIQVISARSMFAEQFPGQYGRWKVEAFKSIIKNLDTTLITNLLCLGDNNIQIEAAQLLGKEFQQSLVKTVKFKQNPKPDQLIKQQQLVSQRMKQIFAAPKTLTIRLERKQQK